MMSYRAMMMMVMMMTMMTMMTMAMVLMMMMMLQWRRRPAGARSGQWHILCYSVTRCYVYSSPHAPRKKWNDREDRPTVSHVVVSQRGDRRLDLPFDVWLLV